MIQFRQITLNLVYFLNVLLIFLLLVEDKVELPVLLQVTGRMQGIPFKECGAQRARERRSDGGLSGARDAHDHVQVSMDGAHEVAPILYQRPILGYCPPP